MAWDGAGNFSLLHDWTDDRDASVKIDASRHDAQDEVLRAGIEASLQKNGENAATGNISMAGNNLTNVDTLEIESQIYLEPTTDPSTGANQLGLFGKDVAGVVQLFAREENTGATTQLTNSADLVLFNEVFG